MKIFGLIGKKLGHSFSKRYFTEKFEKEGISARYELFELPSIEDFPLLWEKGIEGVNVTIPYKEEVMPYLQSLDESAAQVGAVNVVKRLSDGSLRGYNSDCIGFENSLLPLLPSHTISALVLGTGGASKAVAYTLKKRGMPFYLVSRDAQPKDIGEIAVLPYEAIDESVCQQCLLVINTTPLGMAPAIDGLPPLPYHFFSSSHILYDLVYNPEETRFMQEGLKQGAAVKNGLDMLYGQAAAAWVIWEKDARPLR